MQRGNSRALSPHIEFVLPLPRPDGPYPMSAQDIDPVIELEGLRRFVIFVPSTLV